MLLVFVGQALSLRGTSQVPLVESEIKPAAATKEDGFLNTIRRARSELKLTHA
jgi:hypothetical protein